LIANPEVRDVFRKRAQVIREIRSFLDDHGFVEVETPVLQHMAGGAEARPFKSFFNALQSPMQLRIALELSLKKLVVGGLERVYEIGRVFRNEGLSKKHNPEFTMLEFYWSYATYETLMDFTEQMLSTIVQNVCGSLVIPYGERTIDFTPPWPRMPMAESLWEIGGLDRGIDVYSRESLLQEAERRKIAITDPDDWGRIVDDFWGELVEPKCISPTFITKHPLSISPLARRNDQNPEITDRFELIIAGMEAANAFSELNDAFDQRKRFEAQIAGKNSESAELGVDEDFIRALEYGLPPTAGQGIGIDRLVMLLTNSPTIRDVLLFPQMRAQHSDEGTEEGKDAEGIAQPVIANCSTGKTA
jgi:lysyl-tRNA synthetase class 2